MNKLEYSTSTLLLLMALSQGGNLTMPSSATLSFPVGGQVEYRGNVTSNVTQEVYISEDRAKFDAIVKVASELVAESFSLDSEVVDMVDDMLFDLI